MTSTTNFDQLEIEKLISTIDKLTRGNLRFGLNTISEVQTKLLHLKNFIDSFDDTQDILITVDNFMETINTLLPHNNNKLILKQCNNKLGQELEKYKSKRNTYSLFGL